jgi:hypothetical protein
MRYQKSSCIVNGFFWYRLFADEDNQEPPYEWAMLNSLYVMFAKSVFSDSASVG